MVEEVKRRTFGCPLCAVPQELRIDKNGNPYLVCNDCALQMFIRGEDGQKRLGKLLESLSPDHEDI